MKVVIKNIAELVQVEDHIQEKVLSSMKIRHHKNAFLCMEDGIITDFGPMDNWQGIDEWNNTEALMQMEEWCSFLGRQPLPSCFCWNQRSRIC